MVSSGQNCLPSLKYLSEEEINTKQDVSQTSQDEEDLVWSVIGVVRHITTVFFYKKATDKCSQMCVYQLLMPTPITKTLKKDKNSTYQQCHPHQIELKGLRLSWHLGELKNRKYIVVK